jgi:general secretion pathway protein D
MARQVSVREPAAGAPALPVAASASAPEPSEIRGNDRVLAPPPLPPALEGAPVDLRFEDVPLREAVHAILGDLLKQTFVFHPPVEGRLTIVTASQVSPDTAASLLEAALQANGLGMARDARGVFHVGKPESLRAIAPSLRVAGSAALPPGYGAIVIPLRYIGAAEMAAILRPLAPPEALVRVDTIRNLLVMAGSRVQAEGWLSMVSTFDIDLLAGMSVGVFPLKHISVQDVEAAFEAMVGGAGPATAAPRAAQPSAPGAAAAAAGSSAAPAVALPANHPLFGAVRVLPMERINSIVVVTARAAYLDEARRWIERLDRPQGRSSEPRLHVYAVRNGSARHLGEVLGGIFGGQVAPASGASTGVAPSLAVASAGTAGAAGRRFGGAGSTAAGASDPAARVGGGGGAVSSLQLASNVRVVADDRNNAVLVWAPAEAFSHIEDVLRRLDVPPTQVLIEASIIEVTLNDELNYGVQWLFNDTRAGGGTGTGVLSGLNGGVLGGALAGFSYTLRNSVGNVRAVLNLLAEKSLVRVVSSPSLMVLDNHTAHIAVGNQQPIQSSVSVTDGGVSTTSIQYKDTGVNLSVTPSVGSGDLVTMTVNQSVTDVGLVDAATGQRSFLNRQIDSKVAVRSGEAVVLGGLIRDNASEGSSGLPLLSQIPILGGLFGAKSRNADRTELLVIITPRVARSVEDARQISRDLRERLRGITIAPDGNIIDVPIVPSPAAAQTAP